MSRTKSPTPWQALEKYPPCCVRLLAKSGPYTAMTDAGIAIRSGLGIDRVREINFMTSWAALNYAEIRAYLAACRFDPTDAKCRQRVATYETVCNMRKAKPGAYLRRSPKWQTELLPILRSLAATQSAAA